jgi:hypothetical protein
LLRAFCNHHRHLCSLHAAVDLIGVRHPLHKLMRRRAEGQQMSEYFVAFLRKTPPFIGRRLVQGRSNSLCLGLSAKLLGWYKTLLRSRL